MRLGVGVLMWRYCYWLAVNALVFCLHCRHFIFVCGWRGQVCAVGERIVRRRACQPMRCCRCVVKRWRGGQRDADVCWRQTVNATPVGLWRGVVVRGESRTAARGILLTTTVPPCAGVLRAWACWCVSAASVGTLSISLFSLQMCSVQILWCVGEYLFPIVNDVVVMNGDPRRDIRFNPVGDDVLDVCSFPSQSPMDGGHLNDQMDGISSSFHPN